ncbi:MAG TPA: SdpI family protein [Opitutaceae bacterium]|nr:SdpI family protein [Opitutaceae bacterium]
MNPVLFIHFVAAIVVMLVARPLIQRRVKPNEWYGIRVRAAYLSDEAWYEINHYGGRWFFAWGLVLLGVALFGLGVSKPHWSAYNVGAVCVITFSLFTIWLKIARYARSWENRAGGRR